MVEAENPSRNRHPKSKLAYLYLYLPKYTGAPNLVDAHENAHTDTNARGLKLALPQYASSGAFGTGWEEGSL